MPGFDEGTAARGRRDPRLQLELDPDALHEETDGPSEPEEYTLLDGDALMSKITLGPEASGMDAWVTFGVQTRVANGESEEQAFTRLATITVNRSVDQMHAVEEVLLEEKQRRAEALRSTRITRQ